MSLFPHPPFPSTYGFGQGGSNPSGLDGPRLDDTMTVSTPPFIQGAIEGLTLFDIPLVEVDEALSTPFHLKLWVRLAKKSTLGKTLVGKPGTVRILEHQGKNERLFHGLVSSLTHGNEPADKHKLVALELRPRLWFLSLTKDWRVFTQLSALDIIKKILNEHTITFQDKTNGVGLSVRDICVQYGESLFDFISRLMEEEGIFYFFTHAASGHTLVLASDSKGFSPLGNFPMAKNQADDAPVVRGVWAMRLTQTAQINQFSLNDYEPKTPTQNLSATKTLKGGIPLSVYDYPSLALDPSKAERVAKGRLEAHTCLETLIQVTTNVPQMAPAQTFSIKDADGVFKGTKVIMGVCHRYGLETNGRIVFQNILQAFPETSPYHPLPLTPRPLAFPETATVVGPSDKEVHVNEQGCIKVKFHWDTRREAQADERSCWVRVASSWAGPGWGMVHTPRIGQEVVMAFLNRDPDRPVVIGAVYNGLNKSPYPNAPHHSGVRSRSTPQGTSENFNEIMFDDEKGKEKLSVQAEKDAVITVKDALVTTVEQGVMKTVVACGNREVVLQGKEGQGKGGASGGKGDDLLTLEKGSRTVTLKGQGAHLKTSVASGNVEMKLDKGNHETRLQNGDYILHLQKGKGEITLSGGGYTLKVRGGDVSIETTGTVSVKGREVKVEGSSGISLSTMGKIRMDCGEFVLNAKTRASLSAALQLSLEGKAQAALKGATVDVAGQALTKITGALVTLN